MTEARNTNKLVIYQYYCSCCEALFSQQLKQIRIICPYCKRDVFEYRDEGQKDKNPAVSGGA